MTRYIDLLEDYNDTNPDLGYDSDESVDPESLEIDYPDRDEVFSSDTEESHDDMLLQRHLINQTIRFHHTGRPEMIIFDHVHTVPERRKRVNPRLRAECVVCLETLDPNSASFCAYSCGNTFHTKCIKTLVKCPLCRKKGDFSEIKVEDYKKNGSPLCPKKRSLHVHSAILRTKRV
jgi:hypothetical protein